MPHVKIGHLRVIIMNTKTKIAYLDYSPHFAGAEQALSTIIANLDRNKFIPIIVFPYPCEHHHRYDNLDCEKKYLSNKIKWWMGSDFWKRPIRGTDFLKRTILGYKLAVFLISQNIKILHVNLLRPDCLMWLFFCKIMGIHIIGHFRSLPMSWVPSRLVQQSCDVIISVSNIVREHAMSKYTHKHNIVIYDSVPSPLICKQYTRSNIISSVAALFPNKGHDNAIRAFALITNKYPEYELQIVGGGNNQELQRLKDLTQELNLTSKVKFTGKQISNMEIIYAQSKLILSLTKEGEAFGLVPFEASTYNTPFIAPEKGAIKEILKNNISGILVDTEDYIAVARKIDWVLSHYDESIKISENAHEIVKTQLTPQQMDRRIMKIYDSFIHI